MRVPVESVRYTETRDIEEVASIAESIKEKGLIHPITVRGTNGSYELITGLKRLLAFKSLEYSEIEVDVRENCSDEEALEIAIHENLKRKNLAWYDEVLLKQRLHDLRQEEHGVAGGHRPKTGAIKGWSLRDTAAELGTALGPLSEDIRLADAVRTNPALRNIKDKRTAIKLVKREGKRIEGALLQGIATYPIDIDDVFLGSSAEILANLPSDIFDACITDPPWLTFYQGGHLVKDAETWPVFKEIYRVLKVHTFLYAFVGVEDYVWYKENLPSLGFKVSKTPLIWHKRGGMSRIGVAGWEYGRDFELVVLAVKGNPVLTSPVQLPSVRECPVVPTKNLVHPNEKPIDLLTQYIEDCTHPGALILDPFAGSGAVLEAARKLKRAFIGIERGREEYDKIRKRLGID